MKLKQNSFKTVLKLFCVSFISLCGQFRQNKTVIAAFVMRLHASQKSRFANDSTLLASANLLSCKVPGRVLNNY